MRPLARDDHRPASLQTGHRLLMFLILLAVACGAWSVSAFGAEPLLLLILSGIVGMALLTLGMTS